MACRQCGANIAPNALICYRCGTATTEAKFAPVPVGKRRFPTALVVALVLAAVALAVAAFFLLHSAAR